MALRDRIRGVLGFPVTPFHKDLSLDLDALARNVDEMARYPFCAIVAAGGTGELYSMTPEEIEQVVKVSVDAVAGRMPVVAGKGDKAAVGGRIAGRAGTGLNPGIGPEYRRKVGRRGTPFRLATPPLYSHAPEEGLFQY